MPPRKRKNSSETSPKETAPKRSRRSTRNAVNCESESDMISFPSSQETDSSVTSASSVSKRTRSNQLLTSPFSSPGQGSSQTIADSKSTTPKRGTARSTSNSGPSNDVSPISVGKASNPRKKRNEVLVSPNCNGFPSKPDNDDNEVKVDKSLSLIKLNTPESSPIRKTRMSKRLKPASPSENEQLLTREIHKEEQVSRPTKRARLQVTNTIRSENDEKWKKYPKSCNLSNPLLTRVWLKRQPSQDHAMNHNGSENGPAAEFSVLTYNILSETLLKKSHNFPLIQEANYEQNTRHKKLMAEINHINPDIMCLQEVEESYFNSLLAKDLKELGYESILNCNSGQSHGLAQAYRSSKFHLQELQCFNAASNVLEKFSLNATVKPVVNNYLNEPEVCQVAIFEVKGNRDKIQTKKRVLCVANIHVTYAKHLKPDLRCLEVTQAFSRISSMCNKYSISPDYQISGWIFCGDFNSSPTSSVYQLARDGYPNDSTIDSLLQCKAAANCNSQNGLHNDHKNENQIALVNVLWQAFQHPFADVTSCYKTVLGEEPPLTMTSANNFDCLDYIWYGSNLLQPTEVLLPPCEYMRERPDLLPDDLMHSDHASLACKLQFR